MTVADRARPIVLIGAADDEHVEAIAGALRERETEPVVLDSLRFPGPGGPRLSLGLDLDDVRIDGARLGRPGAVYLRSLYLSPIAYRVDVEREMERGWRGTMVVFREKSEFLLALVRRWEVLGVPVYNPLASADRTRKPHQLALLAAAGLPVPATVWTNDPAAAGGFAGGGKRRVAYKPVSGGAATKELGADDLAEDRLRRVENCPVTFQELVPGDDLRVFVLDGSVVAAFRIDVVPGAVDYRQNEQRVDPLPLPLQPPLEDVVLRAVQEIGLRFTGMDLKRSADGTWRILELNPSPMFLGFDRRGRTDILGSLADALIHAARAHT